MSIARSNGEICKYFDKYRGKLERINEDKKHSNSEMLALATQNRNATVRQIITMQQYQDLIKIIPHTLILFLFVFLCAFPKPDIYRFVLTITINNKRNALNPPKIVARFRTHAEIPFFGRWVVCSLQNQNIDC